MLPCLVLPPVEARRLETPTVEEGRDGLLLVSLWDLRRSWRGGARRVAVGEYGVGPGGAEVRTRFPLVGRIDALVGVEAFAG